MITSEDRGLVKYDDFETRFWSETLYPVIMRQFSPELAGDDFETTHRRWAQYQFGAFEQVYDVEGPKFVLAHILLPHPPFVFDANCGPKRDTAQNSNDRAEQYIAQMNCANEYTSNLIKDLLNKSDNEPIIILQADEGSDAVTLNSDRETGNNETLKALERTNILSAYYLPNGVKLPDQLTPVNTFRFIFNAYFSADYKMLDERIYYVKSYEPFQGLFDVTKEMNSFRDKHE